MASGASIDSYLSIRFRDPGRPGAAAAGRFVASMSASALAHAIEASGIESGIEVEGHAPIRSPLALPQAGLAAAVAMRATGHGQDWLFGTDGVQDVATTERHDSAPVLIRLKHPGWDKDIPGLLKGARLGSILSATADAAAVRALAEDPDVIAVEASRGGTRDCAHSMPWIGATAAQAPPLSESGAGAVVAVIDEGLDVLHEAFRDAAGASRVLYLWDQRDATGPAPAAVDPIAFKAHPYGTLHTQAEITGYIAVGATGARLGRDPGGHGTHVASIAAGRALPATGFPGGVAPEAAIVAVIPKLGAVPGDPQSLGYSVTHVDALAFVRAAADKEGMPVAVNVSLGMNAGAHDGSSLLELAFDAFSGGGRDPGYVVVKSAGNEFGFGGHAYVQAFEGGVIPIEWTTGAQPRKEDTLEFWFRSCDDLRFTLVAPTGLTCAVDRAGPDADAHDPGGAFSVYLSLTRFHADNGDSRLVAVVRDNAGGAVSVAGRWRLDILGTTVLSDGGVHGWVERDGARAVHFVTGSVDDQTLSIPATARTVISVGACAPSDPLVLSASSSRGPTRDGRPKPELVAPGVGIVAAAAGTPDGLAAMTGTSMAAPHVTGAVALLLARRRRAGQPQLNAVQVRAALGQTVSRFSGRWQAGFGSGRVDVAALLDAFR